VGHSTRGGLRGVPAAIKYVHHLATSITAADRPGAQTQPIDRQSGLDRLAIADVELATAWEGVLLLGDATTVTAARAWRDAVWDLALIARRDSRIADNWDTVLVANKRARDRYYAAARKSLVERGEPLPPEHTHTGGHRSPGADRAVGQLQTGSMVVDLLRRMLEDDLALGPPPRQRPPTCTNSLTCASPDSSSSLAHPS
jgi:hypothetical protein